MTTSDRQSLDLAYRMGSLAIDKKAREIKLLDVRQLTDYTSYILLLTAGNERHARALADHLLENLRPEKIRPLGTEGYDGGQWILLDFGDIVVHIFVTATRLYYDLDNLWVEAARLPVGENS